MLRRMIPATDTDLRCPTCNYVLAGLPTNRCPECGQEFNLAELRAALAGKPQPVWPRGRFGPVSIWLAVLFTPGRFAREFPRCHDILRANLYSLGCYVLAGLPLIPALDYSVGMTLFFWVPALAG
jgi:hypothetical protein